MNDILTRFLLSKGVRGLMGMLGGKTPGLQQTNPAPGIGTPDYSGQVPPIAPGLPNTGFSIDSIPGGLPGGTFPSESAYQAGWSQPGMPGLPLGNAPIPRVPMSIPSPIPTIPMTIPSRIPNMLASKLPGMPSGTGVLWDYINRVNKP